MPDSLINEFVKKPVRERGGSRASNRLTYQTSWAFCLLLELHSNRNDYLLVLDYHDDVVVLDSSSGNGVIDFFQIKTKKGKPWTIKNLLAIAKDSTHSILGKMYAHQFAFDKRAKTTSFVSNAGFHVKRRSKSKEEDVERCTVADLCLDTLSNVAQALQKEHSLDYCPLLGVETVFQHTSLTLDDHETHAKGRFVDFLAKHSIPTTEVSAAFLALLQELQKRSNCESSFVEATDFNSKKSFSRAEFSKLLDQMRKASQSDDWSAISQQLSLDGLDILTLQAWKRAWSTYQIEKMDFANAFLEKAESIVREVVDRCQENGLPLRPLPAFVEEAIRLCIPRLNPLNIPVDKTKLAAMILTALNETEQSSTLGSQP